MKSALIGKPHVHQHDFRVPVLAADGQPLMPMRKRRAEKSIAQGKATPFVSRGILCVRLREEPSGHILQPVVVGVDPGSKKEGISVLSQHEDLLHLQLDARRGIKEKTENRRDLRRSRRGRNTPCRQPRPNRGALRKNRIPPSTRARWDWRLRTLQWLTGLYPVSQIVVEDIAAATKPGKRKWNVSFSPLEVGKNWFYEQVGKIAPLSLKKGYETKSLRDQLGLKKTKAKLSETFGAHCVDSFVLALSALEQLRQPTARKLLCLVPLDFRRRSLHLQTPQPGGKRRVHGGTRTEGWRKGALIKHPKLGLTYLGGASNNRVSLHSLETGTRLSRNIKLGVCRVLRYNSVRFYWAGNAYGLNLQGSKRDL